MCFRRLLQTLSLFVAVAVRVCSPSIAAALEPDYLIDSDPKLVIPEPVRPVNPGLKALWLQALQRPEADMQRMAAETIARAQPFGIPDLHETIPSLERILQAKSSHPAARFAAARALIALDSRQSGDQLLEASQNFGADLRQLIEPALARWEYEPAQTIWIERLSASHVRRRDLVLAIRGLSQLREQSALPNLLLIAGDLTRDSDLRLEAASAAGQIAESGLQQEAERLARNPRTPHFTNQLCAVRLLARHAGEGAQRVLIELAGHAEPAVVAAALHRLNEIDSALVAPLAESAMTNPDPHVRREGAAAYGKLPTPERMQPLVLLLADAHPRVRREVCDSLFRLAEQQELNAPIRDAAMRVLGGDRWQGQEQAALLLGALGHQPAAKRFVELLESPRTEVAVAAAWGLRKVAVPESIPAVIDKAHRQTVRRRQMIDPTIDAQVAHLCEALGVLQADDAVSLLTQYIPKNPIMGERSRSSAIWALGLIKEGQRDAELESALSDRITDFAEQKSESDLVKQTCMVTLVRMNAVDAAPMLREIIMTRRVLPQMGVALRWAVKQFTGEELPPPEPLTAGGISWFLEPFP